MLDVSLSIQRLLEVTEKVSVAIQLLAYLAIMTGLVVVFSISRWEVDARMKEINLLKALGETFRGIRNIIEIEFGVTSFFAASIGIVASLCVSWMISYIFFENIWRVSWEAILVSLLSITLSSIGVSLLATYKTLSQRPSELLNAI